MQFNIISQQRQSRVQVIFRREQIRRIGYVITILEDQVDQFLLGCNWPVSRSIVVSNQNRLGDLPAQFFLQNILKLHPQE